MKMRNTKVCSITMPPEMAKQAERLAKKESRTMSELMREAFRRYQMDEAERQLLVDPLRARNLQILHETVAQLRKEAVKSGIASMSIGEINAAVQSTRRAGRKKN
jgi:predicted DNA-binding protein